MVLATLLDSVNTRSAVYSKFVSYCFLTPVKLTVVCLIAFFAVTVAQSLGGPMEEAVDTMGVGRLAALFTFAVILSTTSSASALLGMGARTGAFCSLPDGSALGVARNSASVLGAEVLVQNLGNFYVLGQGQNALILDLREARSRAGAVSSLLQQSTNLFSELNLLCPSIDMQKLDSIAASLQTLTDRDLMLLGETAMYGHYDQAIREGFCGKSMQSLGLLVFLQYSLALICFPLVSAVARPWVGQGADREHPANNNGRNEDFRHAGLLESGMNGRLGQRHPNLRDVPSIEGARLLGTEGGSANASASRTGKLGSPGQLNNRFEEERNAEVSGWDFARAYGNSFMASMTGSPGGTVAGVVVGTGFDSMMPGAGPPSPGAAAAKAFGSPSLPRSPMNASGSPSVPTSLQASPSSVLGGSVSFGPMRTGASSGPEETPAALAGFMPKKRSEGGGGGGSGGGGFASPDKRAMFDGMANKASPLPPGAMSC